MTDLQHRKDSSDNRVVEAAPHPKGGEVNPQEYYMTDPFSHNENFFLANPGETHSVWYTAEFGNDTRVTCHALENWHQVRRFVDESIKNGTEVSRTPQQLVVDLREKANKLEKWLEENPLPAQAAFQGMPYAGMKVWVKHPGKPGTLVHVKVIELYVTDGDVCIVTEGWKYFRPDHWFWTEEEATASLSKV